LTIDFPRQFLKDLHYAVVKINLEGENFMKRIEAVFNIRIKTRLTINEKIECLTVFHPVTSQDRNEVKINLSVPLEAKIKSIKYTFLSRQEFANSSHGVTKLENKIHSNLNTKRKNTALDEFYHLKQDMEMNKNLLRDDGAQVLKDKIDDYRKSLYRWFEFYFNKGEKLIGKNKKKKKLTSKEIEILKSLGYL
jgi:hypothetical protein